jgi:Zn-dependent peptidase ImmA (M78 family)
MLSNQRKTEISEMASWYFEDFLNEEGIVDLVKIANSEDIIVIHDNYLGEFEGMTVCDEDQFFIHLDSQKNPSLDLGRSRFTFAHELGHAIINNHRVSLLKGLIEPHQSNYLINNSFSEMELEADYFASCLLMPETSFKSISKKYSQPFSLSSIDKIASHFKTSFLATLLRYVEVGTESVFITFNKEQKIKWYSKSYDFPNWPMKFKVGEAAPINTVVGDYFRDKRERYTEVEVVDSDDWFYVRGEEFQEYNLYEHCRYLDFYNYVISLLWFGK